MQYPSVPSDVRIFAQVAWELSVTVDVFLGEERTDHFIARPRPGAHSNALLCRCGQAFICRGRSTRRIRRVGWRARSGIGLDVQKFFGTTPHCPVRCADPGPCRMGIVDHGDGIALLHGLDDRVAGTRALPQFKFSFTVAMISPLVQSWRNRYCRRTSSRRWSNTAGCNIPPGRRSCAPSPTPHWNYPIRRRKPPVQGQHAVVIGPGTGAQIEIILGDRRHAGGSTRTGRGRRTARCGRTAQILFQAVPFQPLAVRTFAQVAWELSKIVTDAPSAKVVTMP